MFGGGLSVRVCVLPPDTLSLQSLKKSLGIKGDTRASSREVDRLEPGHGCCPHTCSPERKKEGQGPKDRAGRHSRVKDGGIRERWERQVRGEQGREQPGAAPGRMPVEPRRRRSHLETEQRKELQTRAGPRGACLILLCQEGGRSPPHRGCCHVLLSCLKTQTLRGPRKKS